MNEEQENLLENFLNSELDDYGLSWEYAERDDDEKKYEIRIILNGEEKCVESFKIDETSNYRCNKYDALFNEMGDDYWQEINEYDYCVKYFWMKVAPEIWGDK